MMRAPVKGVRYLDWFTRIRKTGRLREGAHIIVMMQWRANFVGHSAIFVMREMQRLPNICGHSATL
jgi:hypothetical protein